VKGKVKEEFPSRRTERPFNTNGSDTLFYYSVPMTFLLPPEGYRFTLKVRTVSALKAIAKSMIYHRE
jgi:hypothetical protein